MGDLEDYDAAMLGAQTELAPSSSETEAVTAWALDDAEEWAPPRRLTPALVTAGAVAASLTLVAVAGVIAWQHLRVEETAVVAAESTMVPATMTSEAPPSRPPAPPPSPPPVTVTTVVVQAPPTQTQAPAANPGAISPQLMAVYDRQFIANMQPHMQAVGSVVEDADLMAYRAHQTCAKLQQGHTDGALAQQLMTEFGLVPSLANAFIRTAMMTYPNCP